MSFKFLLRAALCFIVIPQALAESATAADQENSAAVELRIQKLENILGNQGLLDLLQQVETLQQKVNQLQGEIEVQTHLLEKLKKRNANLHSDIDSRVKQLELNVIASDTQAEDTEVADEDVRTQDSDSAVQKAESTPLENTSAETETEPDKPVVVDQGQAKAAYQSAFLLLKESRYDDAVTAFEQYLNDYPRSLYADNAQYWLAESFYIQQKYEEAVITYQTLLENYPESRKLAHGTLKLGYSYQELEQMTEAKSVLEEVINRFPGTNAAREATNRLRTFPAEETAAESEN